MAAAMRIKHGAGIYIFNSLKPKHMKKALFFLAAIALFACQGPTDDTVRISGIVDNPTDTEVEVFYYKEYVTNSMETVRFALDADNVFSGELSLDEPRFVYLRMPRRTLLLYLQPGADIHVHFDAADSDVLPEITGDKALESQFMMAYNKEIERNYGRSIILEGIPGTQPEDFVSHMDDVYGKKMAFIESFDGYDRLDAGFVRVTKANFLYEKYGLLMEYPRYHAYFNQLEEGPELPEGYYAFLEEEGLFDDGLLVSRPYLSFLGSYNNYFMELDKAMESGDRSYFQAQFDYGKKLFSGKSRDHMLAQAVISALSFAPFEEAQELTDDFFELASDPLYRDLVSGEYKTVLKTAPGNPAPDFTLADINGEEVSLSDFKGKVVYLDFWASWCGPCMREVPYAKELKKRMAGQDDLVFLYISIDTDEEAWRRTVANQEIRGVHLNVPGGRAEVPSLYNVKGVPTFYIIGRDGNIFDNRPPRPSNPLVDERLTEALEQPLASL
jgi:thiol-disulfide isomerase/thioredoxin